jgi:DNA-binding PadR family transcriptional regulator
MSQKRKVSNPLALAVLACLIERPMHPYEMAATMRERHKDESIKLNYGSLYTVTEALQRHRLIEPQETLRDGNRPERTVYRITAAGRLEVVDWLSELIAKPVHEYTQFEGGLSLLPVLPPSDAVKLLEERAKRLEGELAQGRAIKALLAERKLPRLFTIEIEHRWRMKEAELDWVRELIGEIASGALEGVAEWRRWHSEGGEGPIVKLPAPAPGEARRRSF